MRNRGDKDDCWISTLATEKVGVAISVNGEKWRWGRFVVELICLLNKQMEISGRQLSN